MNKTSKISVSLPADVVADLDYMSHRLGVSRSAIIAEMLGESLADAVRLVKLIPPNPTPADVLRMRGDSEELVRQRLASITALDGDLFAETTAPIALTPAQERKEARKLAEAKSMGLVGKGKRG